MLHAMRNAILLSILAALAGGCGQPSKPKASRPKATAKAATPAPQKPAPARPASRPAPPPRPAPRPAPASPAWRVVSVHDGDTVRAIDTGTAERKVRLHGIDAPEIGQPFGTKARDHLATLTKGKAAEIEDRGQDRYGRTLARIEVEGQDVNRAMVAAGLAWHYTRYSDDAGLAAAEREARAARRGLWADAKPVAPWDWRASERERKGQPAGR